MRRGINSYRRLQRGILAFLVLYPTIAIGMTAMLRREFFPFAPWSMFMRVLSERESYEVRLVEVEGEKLTAPRWLNESGQWIPRAKSIAAWELIQEVGRLAESSATDEYREQRLFFERTYLRSRTDVTYELTYCRSQVQELWRGEPRHIERVIDRFHVAN